MTGEVVDAEARGLVRFTVRGAYEADEFIEGRWIGRHTFKCGFMEVFEALEEAIAKAQEMLSDHGNGYMAVCRSAAVRFKYGEPQWQIGRGEVVHVLQAPTGPRHKSEGGE